VNHLTGTVPHGLCSAALAMALLFVGAPAESRSCERAGPWTEVAKNADDVFVARVTAHTDAPSPTKGHARAPLAMEVEVLQVLKGSIPRRVKIWGGQSSVHRSVSSFPVGSIHAFALSATPREMSWNDAKYVLFKCEDNTVRLPDNSAMRRNEIARLSAAAGLK
jgi:hypothetical protein